MLKIVMSCFLLLVFGAVQAQDTVTNNIMPLDAWRKINVGIDANSYTLHIKNNLDYLSAPKASPFKDKAAYAAATNDINNYIDPVATNEILNSIINEFKNKYKGEGETAFFNSLSYEGSENSMLFYLKGFFKDLDAAYKKDSSLADTEELLKIMRKKYMINMGLYLDKASNQRHIGNTYKFKGFVLWETQPVMTSFIYGNSWIALAEVYKSTSSYNSIKKGYYRDIFRSDAIVKVLIEGLHFKLDTEKPLESLVKLNDEQIEKYFTFHIDSWVNNRKIYRLSDNIEFTEK